MAKAKDHKSEGKITDIIKKVVSVGVGASFMSDETVKSFLHDLPLGKEIINGLISNAKKTKTEFISGMREEVSGYLKRVNPKELVSEVLENYDMEVNAKISFAPKAKVKKTVKKKKKAK